MTHEERLTDTYRRFPHLRPKDWEPPEPDIHGDICPHCGHMTLIHESGCVKCTYCDWSACG